MTDEHPMIADLYARRRLGIKPGLETEQKLLALLGHPERALAVIHVAGTNGKGSVCACVEAMLRAAGYRTGLFTSPHLVRLNERFRVGGEPIDDARLLALARRVGEAAATLEAESGRAPTFFEMTTAMAFACFADQRVQLAVMEAGMGGRLDATNVVDPALSVITRIDLDHTAFLGDSLEAVAGEKAGIIKPGRPLVVGAMPDAAADVIRRVAAERKAPCVDAGAVVRVERVEQSLAGQRLRVGSPCADYGVLSTSLLGDHQLENVATAIAVADTLRDVVGVRVPPEAVAEGLQDVNWPGRLQVLRRDPPVLLDGAHNPGAGKALAATLRDLFKGRPVGCVIGMCADKQAGAFLRRLRGVADRVWTVPLCHERGMSAEALAAVMQGLGQSASARDLATGLDEATCWAAGCHGAVCVAGSLFLVGDVLQHLGEEAQACPNTLS